METPGYRVDSNATLTELDIFLKRQGRRKGALPDFNHAMLFIEWVFQLFAVFPKNSKLEIC